MFILKLLSRLSLSTLYVFANVLAFLAYRVVKYRLKVVRYNIALCFPELTEKERELIVKRFYNHLADIAVEAIWFGGCGRENLIKQRIVSIVNPETMSEVAADDKSVVVLTGHTGNWELTGGLMHYNYTEHENVINSSNFVSVYKKMSSKKWNDFLCKNRTVYAEEFGHYDGYLETNKVLRYIIKHNDKQKFYFFITDQHPYKAAKGSIPVTFFGQKCTSMAAGANLAQHFGYAVVYQRVRCVERGHYTYEFITITEDASNTSAQEIMNKFYALLEEDIKAQPEQYLWSHRRFR